MENFKKRIISMLLVLVLCMTMVPATVLAAEDDEWLENPMADMAVTEPEEQQDDLAEPEAIAPETELPVLTEEGILPVEETTIAVEMPALMASGIVASGESDSGLPWTLDNNGKLTVYGSGELYFFDRCWDGLQSEIRSVVINSGVTSIGANVFSNCSNLTSITIPNSVTSIDWYSFGDCSSLASVTIPNSVTSIDWYSFSGCSSLTSVTIPASVTCIGGNVFRNCGNLTNITVESNNASYSSENGILYNKSKTELICCPEGKSGTFSVPYGVTTIAEYAFRGCSNLTSITIPSSVTSIGRDAFAECSNMNSITVNSGNTAYTSQDGVLYNKNKTELICCPKGKNGSFSIPGGVTKIGADAFANCNWLTNITIPNSVTEIAYGSFAYCTGLSSVTIPASVTSIGGDAFWCSSNMNTVTFEGDAPSLGRTWSGVFYDVTATAYYPAGNVTWTDSVKQNYSGDITWVPYSSDMPTIIASGACGAQGDNLTWTLDSEGTLTISGTGKMEDWSGGDAPWYNRRDDIKTVIIENGATSIGYCAFYDCNNLTTIMIPGSVTSISNFAFAYCTGLTNITIPDSVTSIGNYAFYDCSSLVSVRIPSGVTSIGRSTFEYCTNLTNITISDSVTSIGYDAFGRCSNLTNITIPNSVTSIDGYAFEYCTSLTNITIPGSVTSIGERVFRECSSLTGITVDSGNTAYSSQNGVLYNKNQTELICCPARKLGIVNIPSSVNSIGKGAFANCSDLTSITIPESVTEIAYASFADCTSLTHIAIPSGVTEINDYAFAGCTSLANIAIPDGVTAIGWLAFYDCNSLSAVTFEGNAPSIESGAFYTVSATAYYPAGNAAWTDAVKQNYGGNITWVPYSSDMPAIMASGECGAQGDNLTWTLDSNGQLTISGTGAMENWPTWDGLQSEIRTVVINDGVTSVGHAAFCCCRELTGITIPATVTSIGERVFWDSTSLTGITVASGNVLYSSQDGVLYNSDKTELVCCPAGKIGSINIPASVNSIKRDAFNGCNSLSVIMVASGNAAYVSQDGVLYNSGKTVLVCCPAGKSGSVEIPNSVTEIAYGSFAKCSDLLSVTIPDSVTNIGGWAFGDCTNLNTVIFEGNAPTFDSSVFGSVTATAYYPADDTTWADAVKRSYGGHITWVAYTSDMPIIIASGECGAQGGNLTWTLDSNGELTISGAGEMQNCGLQGAPWYNQRTGIKSIVIDNGVTSIGEGAFYYCDNVTDIMIPNSVTSISGFAFDSCSSLIDITIPDSVTSIGNGAFEGCCGLTSITIPNGVTSIDWNTFCNCSNLTSVTIPDSVIEIRGDAFLNCISLTNIAIPNGVTTITYRAFFGCSSLTNMDLPSNVTSIDTAAFCWCNNLTNITIPDSVTYIGPDAFSGCSSLREIAIPNGVTDIAYGTFYNCSSLAEVTIPSSVSTIRDWAFRSCAALNEITFEGDAPAFTPNGSEVFTYVTATAYYPANNATWTDSVKQNYGGNITWVAKDNSDVVDPDALTVTVANVKARAGEEVTVPISISNNPGIMVMQLGISYDKSKLTFIGHEDSGLTGWSVANNMVWLGNSNSSYNGEIVKLKFRVNEGVEDGDIPVTLTYSAGNIANHDEEVFRPVIEAGKVTVYTAIPGDISGDGVVNALDLLRMKKALSGEDVEVVGNMDVTGDGMINALDLLRLQKYLSGEAVTIF